VLYTFLLEILTLSEIELVSRTGFISAVDQPTRGDNRLDRVYLSEMRYDHIKVVTSAVKSDHKAVIAHTGPTITSLNKTSTVKTYRKRSPSQHASFLSVARMLSYTVDKDNDVQSEFDRFYSMAMSLLDQFYPEKSVTITSADPEYVSPAVKTMLRKKNRLMRSGRRVHEAEALARRIGAAIIRFNCTELSRVDAVTDPRAMWDKVRQLTGRTRTRTRPT